MKLLLLPGDGIGPEVIAAARRVLDALAVPGLEVTQALLGGASLDAHGVPLTEEVLARARAADAVLMGAVGGPRWAGVPRALRPEAALLRMRRELGLFANLRPVRAWDGVARSPLRPEVVAGADLVFVRELTGGSYFGEPRGQTAGPDGRRAWETGAYTEHEIARVARVAFALARTRRGRVASVDKANVMETGVLWREVVSEVHAAGFADVALEHLLADAAGMELIRNPRRFDVLLTDNLFGDLLSDVAANVAGSLGLLPSAALAGLAGPGLYEPVHGSAPDIAGTGRANPAGAILSLAMALRHSLGRPDDAARTEAAVARVLADGVGTDDVAAAGAGVGTDAVATAIVGAL